MLIASNMIAATTTGELRSSAWTTQRSRVGNNQSGATRHGYMAREAIGIR